MTGRPGAASDGGRLWWFGALLVAAVVHAELMRRVERLGQAAAPGDLFVTTDSVWIVAGLLLLPFPLVVVLTAVCWFHQRARVTRNCPTYRAAFSAAASVLASAAAAAVLGAAGVDPAHVPHDIGQVVWLVVAILVRDVAGLALIVPAILLHQPGTRLRSVLPTRSEHALEVGLSVFGALFAVVLVTVPALLPLLAVQLGIVGYATRVPGLGETARRDGKTGLLRATYWHELAGREFARARRLDQPVGVLMIDIDRFKGINDRYGHLAGDVALRSVATAITTQLWRESLAGRFGGEEFVVFFRRLSQAQLCAVAERVRQAIDELAVVAPSPDRSVVPVPLTVSIGACWSADPRETLPAVLLAADSALFAAKNAGRNRTQLARTREPLPDAGHQQGGRV